MQPALISFMHAFLDVMSAALLLHHHRHPAHRHPLKSQPSALLASPPTSSAVNCRYLILWLAVLRFFFSHCLTYLVGA